MVKKISKKTRPSRTSAAPAGSVKDSAQQIWQAGLGAFTRAQAEGSKAFESLVKEGMSIQRKTQAAAEEKISEATARVSSMATDITTKATGQWDKLESIFEERVAKALNKLGVPSAKEVNALISRVAVLEKAAQQGVRKTTSPSAPKAPKATAKPVAKVAPKASTKAAAKPAAKPVAAKPKAKAAPAAPAAAKKKPAPKATPAQAAKPATSAPKAAATPAAPAPSAVRADVPTAAAAV